MPPLGSESSPPYPGRSVRHSRAHPARISDQSGHWLIKPGRTGRLPTCASESGSKQRETSARCGAIPGVIGQKSAETIIAKHLPTFTGPPCADP